MKWNSSAFLAAGAAVALAAGCSTTTTGMGGGDLVEQGKSQLPVLFSWSSDDGGISGTMVATLPTTTYQGRFLQITHETQRETLAPMWDGWSEGWNDWPYWSRPWGNVYDFPQFSRYYSGKVIANLRSDAAHNMRCRFNLNDPAAGMAGGGQGECQLTAGRVIEATIERK